ncbi:MAG: hypothetical protein ACI4EY_03540 [Lachnospiraceae bacterium]
MSHYIISAWVLYLRQLASVKALPHTAVLRSLDRLKPCLRTYNQADMIVGCPMDGPSIKDLLFF